ncbi:hypothetical protein CEXT_51511 [Caerostris extrusa]|uniref:Uncharacterized protein n=1 Tax=Caerostris extrusa TaxID=172846 RepID=A0AAV4N713_CAEEX|nr:hypothetical protein CEXT_51511 [Caerostris extrusa]
MSSVVPFQPLLLPPKGSPESSLLEFHLYFKRGPSLSLVVLSGLSFEKCGGKGFSRMFANLINGPSLVPPLPKSIRFSCRVIKGQKGVVGIPVRVSAGSN